VVVSAPSSRIGALLLRRLLYRSGASLVLILALCTVSWCGVGEWIRRSGSFDLPFCE
jgi:glycerol-3-phosphate O-acyltransferase